MRVWREFPSGPTGVFLKKGRTIERFGLMLKPPFFWTATRADSDPNRYFFGKSFAYPLFAAPFVRLFGTNGFLVLNALLMAAAAFCGYQFLAARTRPAIAATLAGAFVMVSVVPVYFAWIAPELFNFTLGVVAYFCWLYKEVAAPEQALPRVKWLFRPRSDVVAALVLGLATFSKVSNALMFPPIVIWHLWRGRWRQAVEASIAFGVVAVGLFAVNMAISGEWNYQGGQDRSTFVHEFPLQTATSGFDVGAPKERNEALTEIIFNRSVSGRTSRTTCATCSSVYAGIVPYFFPAASRSWPLSPRPRRRPMRQWLVLCGGLAQPFFFCIGHGTRLGGGGSVGNRYFMGAHGHSCSCCRRSPASAWRSCRGSWVGLLRRAAGAQSVRHVLLSRQLRRPRAVQDAAGGVDALSTTGQHRRSRVMLWYGGDNEGSAIPVFKSTSSMPTRMAKSRTRASG